MKKLICILAILVPILALADMPIPSTNLVPNWRAVVGIPGGIPRYAVGTNIVGLDGTGATDVSATLNAILLGLINKKQAAVLPAGTFKLTSTVNLQLFTALRGSGTNTVLRPSAHLGFTTPGLGITTNGLAADAARGDFQITLLADPSASLSAGCMMIVQELNDPAFVNINGWEDQGGPYPYTPADQRYNGTRARGQLVLVTNVTGTTVKFTPPLLSAFKTSRVAIEGHYATNGGTNNTCAWAGIEDLTIDNHDALMDDNLLKMEFTSFCWASNVNFLLSGVAETAGCMVDESMNNEVRHCWFTGYGQNAWAYYQYVDSANCLFEDNICQTMKVAWGRSGLTCANVAFANISVNKTNPTTALINDFLFHGAHGDYTLIEGNFFVKCQLDEVHGSSSRTAIFRNWAREATTNSTFVNAAFVIDATNWWASPVGNLQGNANLFVPIAWTYEYTSDGSGVNIGGGDYDFVYSLSGNNQHAIDANCKGTGIRDMNYSFRSNAVEHAASGGAVALDSSILYPSGAPSYWGNLTWPAIDPNSGASYAYDNYLTNRIPAYYRYIFGTDPPQSGGGGGTTSAIATLGGGATISGGAKINLP